MLSYNSAAGPTTCVFVDVVPTIVKLVEPVAPLAWMPQWVKDSKSFFPGLKLTPMGRFLGNVSARSRVFVYIMDTADNRPQAFKAALQEIIDANAFAFAGYFYAPPKSGTVDNALRDMLRPFSNVHASDIMFLRDNGVCTYADTPAKLAAYKYVDVKSDSVESVESFRTHLQRLGHNV